MPPRRELTREEKDDKNRKAREKRSLEDQEAKEVDWLLRGKRQLVCGLRVAVTNNKSRKQYDVHYYDVKQTGNSYAEEKLDVIEREAKEDNRKHAAKVAEEVATMISRVLGCPNLLFKQEKKQRLGSEALDLFKAQLKSRDAYSVSNRRTKSRFSGGVTDEDLDNLELLLSKEKEELLNQLTVHSEAPRIELSQGLSNLTVKKGEQIEVKVRIRGQPNPEVKWFKDGEALINNKDYTISTNEVENAYNLALPVAHESHAGNYTVKATNEHGFDESSIADDRHETLTQLHHEREASVFDNH
ncbi:hypothetical protein DAPPUDRAFT_118692 [Daphnia pulex]|uniref:Ig-like domain-containing protein n=1 Tax=Daphnia pulex TaxID=6669 RepID=E9HWE3_DAPPU|nr:hypothetical protein DAPPUDRAFT_118692 [Daphnia pulex]|eukprot:EFX63939.1 hypothetical protein DAPPUDRAFT_118692 [Daphnia pulex]